MTLYPDAHVQDEGSDAGDADHKCKGSREAGERRFSSQPLCKVRRQAGDGSKAQHHENLADFERIGKQKIKQTGEEHS